MEKFDKSIEPKNVGRVVIEIHYDNSDDDNTVDTMEIKTENVSDFITLASFYASINEKLRDLELDISANVNFRDSILNLEEMHIEDFYDKFKKYWRKNESTKVGD